MATESPTRTRGKELVITRTFAAPRAVVWEAWANLDRARQWWGPKGFTLPQLEADPRPGGHWRAVMRSPDGATYPQHGVYKEIIAPERLVYTFVWGDEGPQSEMLVTVDFKERDGNTVMTFRKGPFMSADSLHGEKKGWQESFDRLQHLVTG